MGKRFNLIDILIFGLAGAAILLAWTLNCSVAWQVGGQGGASPTDTLGTADTTIIIVGSKQDSILRFQEYKEVIRKSLRPAVWEKAYWLFGHSANYIRELEWSGDYLTEISLKALAWSGALRPAEFTIAWKRNSITGEWEVQE